MVCREKLSNVEKCRVLKISNGLSNGGVWRCFGLGGGVGRCLGLSGGVSGWVQLGGGVWGVLGWEEPFLAGFHR